jgi:hypothetical protein
MYLSHPQPSKTMTMTFIGQGSTPLIMEMIGGWGITRDDVLSWVWQSFSLWRSG